MVLATLIFHLLNTFIKNTDKNGTKRDDDDDGKHTEDTKEN